MHDRRSCLPLIGLGARLLLDEWLRDDGEAALAAADKQESPILRDHEGEHGLDDVARGNVDPLQGVHERQFSDNDLALLGSVDQPLEEVRVLNDLRVHDVRAVLVVGAHGGLHAAGAFFVKLFQVLTIDRKGEPISIGSGEDSQARQRLVRQDDRAQRIQFGMLEAPQNLQSPQIVHVGGAVLRARGKVLHFLVDENRGDLRIMVVEMLELLKDALGLCIWSGCVLPHDHVAGLASGDDHALIVGVTGSRS